MAPTPEQRHADIAVELAWVRRLAIAVASDAHAGEEIAQEALLAASRPGATAPGSLKSWLAGAVRKLHLHRLRTEAARAGREAVAARPDRAEDPALALERLETIEVLSRTVRELPEPYREAVLLRWYEGLLPEEIARRTGTPVRTIHSRLNRAIGLLREALDRRSGGDRTQWLSAWIPFLPKSAPVLPWMLLMGLKTKLVIAGVLVAALLTLGFVFGPWKELLQSRAAPPALAQTEPTASGHAHEPALPNPEPEDETRRALGAAPAVPVPAPAAGTRSLRIRVHDAQGLAIAGVALNTMYRGTQGTTASDGTLLVPFSTRLDLARYFPLIAEKEGYAVRAVPLPDVRATEVDIELQAPPAPNVSVTVLDAARVARPGACVVLTSSSIRPMSTPLTSFEEHATTLSRLSLLGDVHIGRSFSAASDSSGIASFHVPAGKYGLIVHAAGHPRYEADLEVGEREAAPLRLTVTLSAGRELRGRVIDERTREPIAGARVWHPGSGCDPVASDARGEFVACVPEAPDVQKVRVYHPDYVPWIGEQAATREFALDPGVLVRLSFVDGGHRPISGPVRLEGFPPQSLRESDVHWAYFRTLSADSEGHVDWRGVKPELLGTLNFGATGFGRVTIPVDGESPLFKGERTEITLIAESLCRVAFVDSVGSPIEGAKVTFTTQTTIAGVDWRTSPGELVEDEPGVYLLPSYFAGLDARVEVTAWKDDRPVVQVVKEPGVALPDAARIALPAN